MNWHIRLVLLGESAKLPILVLGVLLLYIGFPVAVVGATSLLTKCISFRVQGSFVYDFSDVLNISETFTGIAQGLRRLGTFIGLILGPLWAGATLHRPALQLSVPLFLLLVIAVSGACVIYPLNSMTV